jgi:hypothetical protein
LSFEFDWFTFIASLNPAAAATTGEEPTSDLSRQKATRESESYSIADLHFVFTSLRLYRPVVQAIRLSFLFPFFTVVNVVVVVLLFLFVW